MSASNKKKLRKEQNAAVLTEKQLKEQQEAKKLKTYTWTFVIAMILVIVIAIGSVIRIPITGAVNRSSHAININNHQLSATDLTYYIVDAINDHYNEAYKMYGNYASMLLGFKTGTPLNEQKYTASEDFETWADYFMDKGIENAKKIYALYDDAVAKGHKLSETEQKTLDSNIEAISTMAKLYGYSNANAYLRATYGTGANLKTYTAYYTINSLASSYFDAHSDSLKYTDDDFRAYEKDKFNDYSSFSYGSYTLPVSSYLTGGTKSEDGKTTTYSDTEKEQAKKDAKADADKLVEGTYKDFDAFEKAIKALKINEKNDKVSVNKYEKQLFTNITNEDISKWLTEDGRKEGDLKVIEVTSTSKDKDGKETKTTTGYTVVYFMGCDDNKVNLVDVRHILVKFDGGKTDSNGNVSFTVAEKEAAKKAAEEILNTWKNGEATEESFAELAKKKSEDTGSLSNGGLYEKVYPGQMVTSFNDWCFDANRKTGDTGLIASEHGYHVMYFVKTGDTTFRDYLIEIDMRNEDMTEWHDELTKKVSVEEIDMSRIDLGYKFG